MATERKENVEYVRAARSLKRQRVVERKPTLMSVVVSRGTILLWLVGALILAFIGFRFILLAFNANPANSVVDLVYDVSAVFVDPFLSMVGTYVLDSGGVVEWSSLIALAVYLLVFGFITVAFQTLFSPASGTRTVKTSHYEEI